MKAIKLNKKENYTKKFDGYDLDSTEKYVINIEDEREFQFAIMGSFQLMGPHLH